MCSEALHYTTLSSVVPAPLSDITWLFECQAAEREAEPGLFWVAAPLAAPWPPAQFHQTLKLVEQPDPRTTITNPLRFIRDTLNDLTDDVTTVVFTRRMCLQSLHNRPEATTPVTTTTGAEQPRGGNSHTTLRSARSYTEDSNAGGAAWGGCGGGPAATLFVERCLELRRAPLFCCGGRRLLPRLSLSC